MYWYNFYPYSTAAKAEEAKYSTTYLEGKIGKPVCVTLNYTSNSAINQNVEVVGILKEVGNDYFVITQAAHGKSASEILKDGEDVFFYTVNLARMRFLNRLLGGEKQQKQTSSFTVGKVDIKKERNRQIY